MRLFDPGHTLAKRGFVHIRVPELPLPAVAVVREVGVVLATSANLHGEPNPGQLEDLRRRSAPLAPPRSTRASYRASPYRRELWERRRFAALAVGEDTRFVRVHARRALALVDDAFFVGPIHGANTSPKAVTTAGWTPRPVAEVARRLGADFCRFQRDRHQRGGRMTSVAQVEAEVATRGGRLNVEYNRLRGLGWRLERRNIFFGNADADADAKVLYIDDDEEDLTRIVTWVDEAVRLGFVAADDTRPRATEDETRTRFRTRRRRATPTSSSWRRALSGPRGTSGSRPGGSRSSTHPP